MKGLALIGRELAVRAFEQGYAQGSDARSASRRHEVDPVTHEHWKAGFEAGRQARERATTAYRRALS